MAESSVDLIQRLNREKPGSISELKSVVARLSNIKGGYVDPKGSLSASLYKLTGQSINVSDPTTILGAINSPTFDRTTAPDYIPTTEAPRKHDFSGHTERETDEEKKERILKEVDSKIETLVEETVKDLSEGSEKIKEKIATDEDFKKELENSVREMALGEAVVQKTITETREDGTVEEVKYEEATQSLASKDEEQQNLGEKILSQVEEKGLVLDDGEKAKIKETAKEKMVDLQGWEEKKINTVMEYQRYKLEEKIERSILRANEGRDLTDKQKQEIGDLSKMMAKMYMSSTTIELERKRAAEDYGATVDNWDDAKNLFGVATMKRNEFWALQSKFGRIKRDFVKEPGRKANGEDNLIFLPMDIRNRFLSFSRVTQQIGSGEGQLNLSVLRGYVNFFKRFGVENKGIFGKLATQTTGRLFSQLGGQTIQTFARGTLKSMFGNFFGGNMGGLTSKALVNILGAFGKAGLKAVPYVGWAIAALDIIKKIGGFFKNIIKGLGSLLVREAAPRTGFGGALDTLGDSIPKPLKKILVISSLPLILLVCGGAASYQTMNNNNLAATQVQESDYVESGEEYEDPIPGEYISKGGITVPVCSPNDPNQNIKMIRLIALSVNENVPYNNISTWRCIGPCDKWGQRVSESASGYNSKHPWYGMDCAKFVSWVWYQCLKGLGRDNQLGSSAYLAGNPSRFPGQWKDVSESIESVDDLVIGDVLYKTGHAAIYIGKDDGGTPQLMESTRNNDNPHIEKVTSANSNGVTGNKKTYYKIIRPVGVFSATGGSSGGSNLPGTFKVGTFNIGNLNKNNRPTAEEIGIEIKKDGLDIVGMQEIDYGGSTTKSQRVSNASGLSHFFHTPTSAGNSVLSSASLINTTYNRVTNCGRDSFRAVQRTTIKINGRDVVFYNTHIDPDPSCRQRQFKDVVDIVKRETSPWILTGDFNFANECNSVNESFSEYNVVHDENYGTRCTDMIIFPKGRGLELISSQTYRTNTTLSDHNLVSATIKLD